MTPRWRIVAFGSAGVLVVAGVACAAALGGGIGQILALVLIGLGLVAATSLVFLEVGLSEDRERAREGASPPPSPSKRASRPPSPSKRRERLKLGRSRGHRRRLR